MGTHCELQTLRFDKNNFKQYKEKDMIIPAVAKPLTFATYLNK